ncbi:MAG: 3-deoxy-D-manno-octulosonic acid transferase, partial [Deltaproteobacteria bacterium]
MLLVYHFLATLLLTLFFPVLYPLRDRIRLRERLALGLPNLAESAAGRLWVHALSVGEVLSSIPLLEALKRKYPSRELVLS